MTARKSARLSGVPFRRQRERDRERGRETEGQREREREEGRSRGIQEEEIKMCHKEKMQKKLELIKKRTKNKPENTTK